MRKLTLGVALVLAMAHTATADPITSFAVFGQAGVTLSGTTVTGGLTGSNNNVTANAFTSLTGTTGGGTLDFNGSAITNTVVFNGGVTIGNFVSGTAPINSLGTVSTASTSGPITAGGDVSASGTVVGNVLAGGNFASGVFNQIQGSIGANKSVTINGSDFFQGGAHTVTGNVVFGTTFTINPGATVGGTVTQGTSGVNPLTFSPVTLPPAGTFAAGGADVTVNTFQSLTLPPGSYGALSLAGGGNLTLTAGNYFFTSINSAGPFGFGFINLDLTNGPINVFVTGDINLINSFEENVVIKGVNQTDPTLGQQVFFESETGNINLAGFAFNSLFGTFFAPNGNISAATFSNLNGSLIAGGTVTTGSGTINFEGSSNLAGAPAGPMPTVPEPSSLALLSLGGLALACWRQWKKRATA
jgi:PEP-CTERM motif